MKTTEQITWRKATEEEIEKGLDSPINKGMFEVSREIIEVEESTIESIDINSLTDEQILKLKARFEAL